MSNDSNQPAGTIETGQQGKEAPSAVQQLAGAAEQVSDEIKQIESINFKENLLGQADKLRLLLPHLSDILRKYITAHPEVNVRAMDKRELLQQIEGSNLQLSHEETATLIKVQEGLADGVDQKVLYKSAIENYWQGLIAQAEAARPQTGGVTPATETPSPSEKTQITVDNEFEKLPENDKREAERIMNAARFNIIPGLAVAGARQFELSEITNLKYLLKDFPQYKSSIEDNLVLKQLLGAAQKPDENALSRYVAGHWGEMVAQSYAATELALKGEGKEINTDKISNTALRFAKRSFDKHPVLTTMTILAGTYGMYKLCQWLFSSKESKESKDKKTDEKESGFWKWGKTILGIGTGVGALYLMGKYFGPSILKSLGVASNIAGAKSKFEEGNEKAKKGEVLSAAMSYFEGLGITFDNLEAEAPHNEAASLVNEIIAGEKSKLPRISARAISVYRKIKFGDVDSMLTRAVDIGALRGVLNFDDAAYSGAVVKALLENPKLAEEIQRFRRVVTGIKKRDILPEDAITDDMTIGEIADVLSQNRALIRDNYKNKPFTESEGKSFSDRAVDSMAESADTFVKDLRDSFRGSAVDKQIDAAVADYEKAVMIDDGGVIQRWKLVKELYHIITSNGGNIILRGSLISVYSGGKIVLQRSWSALSDSFMTLLSEQSVWDAGSVYLAEACPLLIFGAVSGGAWGFIKNVGGNLKAGALTGALKGTVNMGLLPLKLAKMATIDASYTITHFREYANLLRSEVDTALEYAGKKTKWISTWRPEAKVNLENSYRVKRYEALKRKHNYLKRMRDVKPNLPVVGWMEKRMIGNELRNLHKITDNLLEEIGGGAHMKEMLKGIAEMKNAAQARALLDRYPLLKAISGNDKLYRMYQTQAFRTGLGDADFLKSLDTFLSKNAGEENIANKLAKFLESKGITAEGALAEEAVKETAAAKAQGGEQPLEKAAKTPGGKYVYMGQEYEITEEEIRIKTEQLKKQKLPQTSGKKKPKGRKVTVTEEEAVQALCEEKWATPQPVGPKGPKGQMYRYRGGEFVISPEDAKGKSPVELAKFCEAKYLESIKVTDVKVLRDGTRSYKVGNEWVEAAPEAKMPEIRQKYLEQLKRAGKSLEFKDLGNTKLLKYLPILEKVLGPTVAAIFIYHLETATDKRKAVAEGAVGFGAFYAGMKGADWMVGKRFSNPMARFVVDVMGGLAAALKLTEPIAGIVQSVLPHFIGEQQVSSEMISLFEKQTARGVARSTFGSLERGILRKGVEKIGMKTFGKLLAEKVEKTALKKVAEFVSKSLLKKLGTSLGVKGAILAVLIADDATAIGVIDDVVAVGMAAWMAKDIYDIAVLADQALKIKTGMKERGEKPIKNVEFGSEVDKKAFEDQLAYKGKTLEEMNDSEIMEVIHAIPQIRVKLIRDGIGGYEEYQFVKGEVYSMKIVNPDGKVHAELKASELNKQIAVEPPREFRPMEINPNQPDEKLLATYRLAILQMKSECGWTHMDYEILDKGTIRLKRLDSPETVTIRGGGNSWAVENFKSGLSLYQAVTLGNLVNRTKDLIKKEGHEGGSNRPFELDGNNIDFDRKFNPVDLRILSGDAQWLGFYDTIGLTKETVLEALNAWYGSVYAKAA